jgi:hypothetical protein
LTTKTTTTTNGHKCDLCPEAFKSPQELGRHKLYKHKIKGKSAAATRAKHAKLAYQCPDCPASYGDPRGLGNHRSRVHGIPGPTSIYKAQSAARKAAKIAAREGLTNQRKHRRELVKIEATPTTIAATNGHRPQEESHPAPDGIPEATLALALGEFKGLCTRIAFEYDLPPRTFTARLAALIYASQVR